MERIEKRQSKVNSLESELLNSFGEKIKLTIENISMLGTELRERLTSTYVPITTSQLEFPAKDARKYENYLVAVTDQGCFCFNFVMKDGSKSKEKVCGNHKEVLI
jgi:hypothetical protein